MKLLSTLVLSLIFLGIVGCEKTESLGDNNKDDSDSTQTTNTSCASGESNSVKIYNNKYGITHYVVLDQMPSGLDYLVISSGNTETLHGVCTGLRAWYAYGYPDDAISGDTQAAYDQGNIEVTTDSIVTIEIRY